MELMVASKTTTQFKQKFTIIEELKGVTIMGTLCGLCSHPLPELCLTSDKTGQTYPGYCNQYCFTAFRQGIREKVPLRNYSDHARLNGHMVWPYINIPCGWCSANKIEIKHNHFGRSNRVFCSRNCYKEMCTEGGRRAFARFLILRNMALNPTKRFTASQLSALLEPYGSIGGSLNGRAVASILRVYVARGTVRALGDSTSTKEYQIASSIVNSPTPLGKYV